MKPVKFEIEETPEYKKRVAFESDSIKAIILSRLGRTEWDALPQYAINNELVEVLARMSVDLDALREEFHKRTCVRGDDEEGGLVVDAH